MNWVVTIVAVWGVSAVLLILFYLFSLWEQRRNGDF
jgi:hypothetical protein